MSFSTHWRFYVRKNGADCSQCLDYTYFFHFSAPAPSTTRNPNPSPEPTTVDPEASFPDHPAFNPLPIWNSNYHPECLDPPSKPGETEVDKKLAKVTCELEATKKSLTDLVQQFNKRLNTISRVNIDLKTRMDIMETILRGQQAFS